MWSLSAHFDQALGLSKFTVALFEAIAGLDTPAKEDEAFKELFSALAHDRSNPRPLPLGGLLRAWMARLAGTILLHMDQRENLR